MGQTDCSGLTMVSNREIAKVCRQIVEQFHPQKVILFGSYAYGKPTPDSDVDLLVVLPGRKTGIHKAIEILDTVDPHFAIDLIVRTPQQLRQRLEWNDFFLKEIVEKGKVLYESTDARVD
jgi:predicted nucleotidyltransferase